MSKTGDEEIPGTAEGAVMGRAAHTRYANAPVLNDTWAIKLLAPQFRDQVLSPNYAALEKARAGFDPAPVFAIGLGSLRYAEDAVDQAVSEGIDQYVVLGAGFDTFALRRTDLAERLRVFEVDFPDVQALKRERIFAADSQPTSVPAFVPVDFESTRLADGLRESEFDVERRAIFSWMNTIPYLTNEALESTLKDVAEFAAVGSRLVLNYSAAVPLTPAQIEYLQGLQAHVSGSGEPMRSRFAPEEFIALLERNGFRTLEHATEQDLTERYFAGRADGLAPGLPARLVLAELSAA